MINSWVERGRLKASYRKNGELEIRDLGPAEYAGFVKKDTRVVLPRAVESSEDFPGWVKHLWLDWEDRKKDVEANSSLVFEGDVSPVRRFLTDHYCEIQAPRRAYIDLETDSRQPFSQAVVGGTTLLCWALVDEEGNRHTAVLDKWREEAEAELWAALWACMGAYDQIAAWNGDRFDFTVMKARCDMLAARHARRMDPYWEHRRRLLLVDQLLCFKRHHMAAESGDEKTSMRLDDVCGALIGEKKHDFDAGETYEVWLAGGSERQRLVEYCLQDTALLPKLEAASQDQSARL